MKMLQYLKVVLFAALASVCMGACSDEVEVENEVVAPYQCPEPFFVDGKYWIVSGARRLKFTVVGDTIIEEITAKKIQSEIIETGEKSPDFKICYEKNGIVYYWLDNIFKPLFDFSAEDGDIVYYRDEYGREIMGPLALRAWVMYFKMEGIWRKTITLHGAITAPIDELTPIPYLTYEWFEGIGIIFNYYDFLSDIQSKIPLKTDPFWDYGEIEYCYVGDQLIFDINKYGNGLYEYTYDTIRPQSQSGE